MLLIPNVSIANDGEKFTIENIDLTKVTGDQTFKEEIEQENGFVFGITDFTFTKDELFLLNSANKSFYSIKNNTSNKLLTLEDMDTRLFDKKSNTVAIWGYIDGRSAIKLANLENNSYKNYQIPDEISEAVLNIKLIDNFVNLVVSQNGDITTYIISLDNNDINIKNILKGEVLNENIIYKDVPIDRDIFSRKLIINENNYNKEIIINTYLPLVTIQLLGKVGDLYVVNLIEDSSIISDMEIISTIVLINKDGTIVKEKPLINNTNNLQNLNSITVEDGNIININENIKPIDSTKKEFLQNNVNMSKFKELTNLRIEDIGTEKFTNEISISENSITSQNISPMRLSGDRIINNAKQYHMAFGYYYASYNSTTDPNWRKPAQLTTVNTWYNMMPYSFAGYDSPSECINKLNNAYLAGHAASSRYSGVKQTTGIDCSGLVCKAWETSTRYDTRSLHNAGNKISTSNLQKGDILNLAGSHVMIVESVSNGVVTVYEATYSQYTWGRVAHTTHYLSTLINKGYVAYRIK